MEQIFGKGVSKGVKRQARSAFTAEQAASFRAMR